MTPVVRQGPEVSVSPRDGHASVLGIEALPVTAALMQLRGGTLATTMTLSMM